ncbi:hypothetical protein HELRODRAFT_165878 [Helobdella robusta]|uniref:Uncharacterized protein n=1 Tax=Helobdella robusta TaxID=6412 RepID=T1EXE3_HELRO|nr:hypothetical protein HELRODRAFT_165878 [Helobdella robusta]ESN91798.1 hypothetical protein HELRODRAFT_165878 [Helobdella robusta]
MTNLQIEWMKERVRCSYDIEDDVTVHYELLPNDEKEDDNEGVEDEKCKKVFEQFLKYPKEGDVYSGTLVFLKNILKEEVDVEIEEDENEEQNDEVTLKEESRAKPEANDQNDESESMKKVT